MNHRDTEAQRQREEKKERCVNTIPPFILCVSVTLWFVLLVLLSAGDAFAAHDADASDPYAQQEATSAGARDVQDPHRCDSTWVA
jgi:hypothetical protein